MKCHKANSEACPDYGLSFGCRGEFSRDCFIAKMDLKIRKEARK